MSNIFIIGSTGGVGLRLAPLLIKSGHKITGLYRKESQKRLLEQENINPFFGDIIDITEEELTFATKDSEIIVFCAGAAGSGLDRTKAIDKQGVLKAINAAKNNTIKKFYIVSVFMDALRNQPRNEGFEFYMQCKREADNAIIASDLEWVILRPGTLVSEEGNGLINANFAVPYSNVSRGNVAKVLAKLIDTPNIKRKIIELTDGDTPINEAVNFINR
jgi:uncharacterized protein YbjT (DUF2867 family)